MYLILCYRDEEWQSVFTTSLSEVSLYLEEPDNVKVYKLDQLIEITAVNLEEITREME